MDEPQRDAMCFSCGKPYKNHTDWRGTGFMHCDEASGFSDWFETDPSVEQVGKALLDEYPDTFAELFTLLRVKYGHEDEQPIQSVPIDDEIKERVQEALASRGFLNHPRV